MNLLNRIKNQNVISYKEAFIEPTTQSLWYLFYQNIYSIVMEYADNGDLF